jgi:trk system potassium uptake protein TrkA
MRQYVVIGLGRFGYYLAASLFNKGHEVLAMDKKPSLVQEIRDEVSQAVVGDGSDRKVLEALEVGRVDPAVVGIGTNLEASVLVTLNLKDLGVGRIIAKATSATHRRLLYKVGASEVIFPERDQADMLAERLHNPNILDYLPFMEDHSIAQISPPAKFVGKSLMELNLINRFGVQVLAVKVAGALQMIPTGSYTVNEKDELIILGPNKVLEELQKEAGEEIS